ncbi:D-alanyl-D-alanine carboxypeptidase family protein [Mechercharimyces sp. CAU 1602]|uniref:D-alanyl-D-alanine carboxypeptidase family protein n=1 Tax=Mechercharimyces sp. CAU 1602 TaxID=2973933 RepID=UPI00216221FD|nr:D-alanyl-D-alanine carboxypeptidase family protein [Mechercharimyces sp. CAU 1602]MCS1350916.1 D-alanyl-D-alanine carboxypeptidase [Mechercharimyces sp. CAU 1602]
MLRVMRWIGCGLLCLSIWITPGQIHAQEQKLPQVSAEAAALIDGSTGRILYEKNADSQMKIASITKVMTAILAIEHGDLEEEVTVTSRAEGVEGSSIYLKAGEKIPLEHLLYGLMLRSGNDAAVAIAEHIGGSVEGFVHMMNEKVDYLGLANTHFANPHGLDDPQHYSTAADFARISAYALQNSEFQEIVQSKVATVPWPGEEWNRKWYNKNKMLRMYEGADGVKTGYTKRSGRTLVSSATRDRRQLITVTLNAPDDWNDSMQMFEYGFQYYPLRELVAEGESVQAEIQTSKDKMIHLTAGRSFAYPLTDGEADEIRMEPLVTTPLNQISKAGQEVGTMRIYFQEEMIGSVPIQVNVEETEEGFLSSWVKVLARVLGWKEGEKI